MPGGEEAEARALEVLAAEIESTADRLADAAMEVLRSALGEESEEAAGRAQAAERLLNRARAAVEKAAGLTRQAAVEEAGHGGSGRGRAGRTSPSEDWDLA